MKPNVFQGLAAIACAVSTLACGGDPSGQGGEPTGRARATLASLENDALIERTYLGVTQDVRVGPRPAVGTFDLVGGAEVDIEMVTRDGTPLVADLWQVHVDGWATLVYTVDERSGFVLHAMHADEDSSWILRFPAGHAADVVVHIDCNGGSHGCAPYLQPGDRCPAGWTCDEGLTCVVAGDVCERQP